MYMQIPNLGKDEEPEIQTYPEINIDRNSQFLPAQGYHACTKAPAKTYYACTKPLAQLSITWMSKSQETCND